MTLKEDYVSFEIAKLLKEKGFDERTEHRLWYVVKQYSTGCHWNSCTYKVGDITREYDKDCCILMPTHQMAMKWLREMYDLHIIAYPFKSGNDTSIKHYCCQVFKTFNLLGYERYIDETLTSYEEAVEAALKYSLENLI